MRITERDVQLVRDLALSHALSRDQILDLGYFTSVTRLNTRLRELVAEKLVRVLATPFYAQSIYSPGAKARNIVGERIARLLENRRETPRFLQHALCTTNIRLYFTRKPEAYWRFEQQSVARFTFMGKDGEVRPDGLVLLPSEVIAVETDLGNTPAPKFAEKLRAYESFARSNQVKAAWGFTTFTLLVVTTGPLRARHLTRLAPREPSFTFRCEAHDRLGIPFAGNWS